MPIIRVNHIKKYTVIDNNIFFERNMSLKAKGLLCFALSLRDDFKFSKSGLCTLFNDKLCSLETALKELEQYYYLKREPIREKGKFNTEYTFYEVPYTEMFTNEKKPRGTQSGGINRRVKSTTIKY